MLKTDLARVAPHFSCYRFLGGWTAALVLVAGTSRPANAADVSAESGVEVLRAVTAGFDANFGMMRSAHFRYSVTRRDFTVDAPVEHVVTIPGDRPSKVILRTTPESIRHEDTWIAARADRELLRAERRPSGDALSDVFAYDGRVWRWWQPASREMRVFRQDVPPAMLPIDPRKHGAYELEGDLPRRLQRGNIVRCTRETDGRLVLHVEYIHDDAEAEMQLVEQLQCHFDSEQGLLPTAVTTLWDGVRSSDVFIEYRRHESSGMYVPSQVTYRFFGDDGEKPSEETVYQLVQLEEAPSLDEAFFAMADVAEGTVIFDQERAQPYEFRPLPPDKGGRMLWLLWLANVAVIIAVGIALLRRRLKA